MGADFPSIVLGSATQPTFTEDGEEVIIDAVVTLRVYKSAAQIDKQCRCQLSLLKSSKRNCSRLLGVDKDTEAVCMNHRIEADHVWYEMTSAASPGCDWSLCVWDFSSGKKECLLVACTFPSAKVCKQFRELHATYCMRPADDYEAQVTDIYEKYNPEKLKTPDFVKSTLVKYAGKEEELLSKLKAKYSVGAGLPAAGASPGDPQCFLDISIGGQPAGRLTVRLFKGLIPRIAVRGCASFWLINREFFCSHLTATRRTSVHYARGRRAMESS
jgi:hypothetical protein